MMNQGESDWLEPSVINVVYSFLKNCSNSAFAPQLEHLEKQLLIQNLWDYQDGELQTDGNGCSQPLRGESGSETDPEIFRIIGAKLAVIGDEMSAAIEPSLINDLVRQFATNNLSTEEITRRLSQAVQEVVQSMPLDMEQERAMLVIAMVLTKKVATAMPSLLHRVFSATVNYINHNLRDYVNNLASEG